MEIKLNLEIKPLQRFFFKNLFIPKVVVNFGYDLIPSYDIFSELEKAENDLIKSYSSFVHRYIKPQSPEKKNENIENIGKEITIKFNNRGNIIQIKMDNTSMVAELIYEYLEKTKLKNGTFKFNGNELDPMDPTSLCDTELKDNSEIIVE